MNHELRAGPGDAVSRPGVGAIGTGRSAGPPPASFREARRRLSTAQKSTVGVPAYLRFVNRRAGGHLAAVAYSRGLTPSQVTCASAAASAAAIAGVSLLRPTWPVAVVVTLLLVLGYALDSDPANGSTTSSTSPR